MSNDELARILAGQGAIDAQAMDQLRDSTPGGERNWRNTMSDTMDWAEINVLHPLNRAGMLPMRELAKRMDPTGREPFYHPQGPGDYWWSMYGPPIRSIGAIGDSLGYEPGSRESANVEVRPLRK